MRHLSLSIYHLLTDKNWKKISTMSVDVMADGNEHRTADDAQNAEKGQVLETEHERKARINSLRIIYFTMFLMTLGFSIILTGIWPYLSKVN